jgi:eukaryotic-like serine/threonine-protein kinase
MGDLLARLQRAVGDAYRIERELGGGGMSRLFLATEASLHRTVVIKLLPPEFTSEVSAARFKQEIELAAHLQHPNILPVLSAGAKDDLLFYVMPFVSGESLRHRLTREGRLPVADAVRILHEIADALAYAHAEGVIHRDIKPENILLPGSHAVLTDFGVARALAESRSGGRITDTGLALGTPGYMSPEQAAGERNVDARADVYALAVVGYEMLAGQPPFAGPTAQALIAAHLTATPKPVNDLQPETPPEVASAIARALAKDPNARLRTAAEFRDAIGALHPPRRLRRLSTRARVAVGATAVAIVAGAATFLVHSNTGPALDGDLVAVAPFDVLAPDLALWHEGLVDVLSRDLDGAGPLRTVSPTVVVRRWSGRADPTSATELGQRTGARIIVFGSLEAAGRDSVRLAATVFDVSSASELAELEVRDAAVHMDRVGDTLTVRVLRELGRTRPIGAARLASLGSTSFPAIKAFLRAEQFYRHATWDSALVYAQRAIAIDSNFTLALRRIPLVLWWGSVDTSATAYELRAGGRNHGLAPRESLLVAVDSLTGALDEGEASEWPLLNRLYKTLEEAVRRYPNDPEVWYLWGNMAYAHYSPVAITAKRTLDAYQRAVDLDSAFGPAYEPAVELALRIEDLPRARKYVAAERALRPASYAATSLSLLDKLLSPADAGSPDAARMLDTVSGDALFETFFTLRRWPDSAETDLRLARMIASAAPRHGYEVVDPSTLKWLAPVGLAYRGHLHAAYGALAGHTWGSPDSVVFAELALLGVVPQDSAAAVFGRWRRANVRPAAAALGWWAMAGDTASIHDVGKRADSLGRIAHTAFDRDFWRYVAASCPVYRALALRDTTRALALLATVPDSLCPDCVLDALRKGQLLAIGRRDREAAELLEREPHNNGPVPINTVFWPLERGRVDERIGRKDEAVVAYRFVADVWRNADPELQTYVAEARAALKRLGGEQRR